ncbi:MAG: toprim domain-containing protein [Tissierellaceae bacterium]|nr:toprim domain-containing protein [Tissierellaceae bacterium]
MFYINKNPILAGELEVLNELKAQLASNGIERFAEFKPGPRNIQFNCPIHAEGQERKPSCGISTVNKEEVPAGTVHCFTCGYTASLEQMVSHCFGKDDEGAFGKEWLIKNFLTISIENRKDIILDLQRGNNKSINNYIAEEELDSYRYYHPYMYKRRLTNEVIEQFDVGYDNHFELKDKFGKVKSVLRCLTFPIRDINGNTLFIARRSVDIKFFHYPEGVDKPIYGLYELPKNSNEIIVCESILNALTCYTYGKPAVALLGLGTEYQYDQLRKLRCRKLITALDPDAAGQKATARLKKALNGSKLVTSYDIPERKDINDLEKEEFENLQELF